MTCSKVSVETSRAYGSARTIVSMQNSCFEGVRGSFGYLSQLFDR